MPRIPLPDAARGTHLRFAASSRDVLALGSLWRGSSISSSDTEMSGEAERDAVKVVLPLTDTFANDYVKNPARQPHDRYDLQVRTRRRRL